MNQPQFAILCVPINRGPNSLSSCSTGQPRSSMSLAFGMGDTSIPTSLDIMLIFEPPRDLLKCSKSCSSLFVRKGTSLLAKLLLRQSKTSKRWFSSSLCVCKSGFHWPNGDIHHARRRIAYQDRSPVKYQEIELADSHH